MSSFMSGESTDNHELRAAINAELDRITKVKKEIHTAQLNHWRQLLGPFLNESLRSRATAEAFVTHDDPRVRQGALTLLAHYWKPNPAGEDVLRKIASCDDDPEVRAAAVSCLIALHSEDKDKSIANLLADCVRDESNSLTLRAVAYLGLLRVQGIAIPDRVLRRLAVSAEQISEVVDWAIVDSVL